MWEWLQNIGHFIWSWLPLLGLVGFISAFFTLRDRFRNWRAGKNKKAFEHQIKRELVFLESLIRYNRHPILFFIDLIKDSVFPAISLIGSLICFILYAPSPDILNPYYLNFLGMGVLLICPPIIFLFEIQNRAGYLLNPGLLLTEVAGLISLGSKKNWLDFPIFSDLLEKIDTYKKITLDKDNILVGHLGLAEAIAEIKKKEIKED